MAAFVGGLAFAQLAAKFRMYSTALAPSAALRGRGRPERHPPHSGDDERGARHWKTEIVASHVEMLSGRRKKDYEAQQAADWLASQATALGDAPAANPIADGAFDPGESDEDSDEPSEAAEAAEAA